MVMEKKLADDGPTTVTPWSVLLKKENDVSNQETLISSEDAASLEAIKKSGLCYDPRMRFHATLNEVDDHPEDPRRVLRVFEAIRKAGYVSNTPSPADAFLRLPSREATLEELLRVHTPEMYEKITKTELMSREDLANLEKISDSLYFNNESAFCARLACGSAIETCAAVVTGKVKNAFAVVRPPGHHAEPHKPGGFCLFNNVSVAARSMLQRFPDKVKRILIIDWDVHHGNGTQMAFYDDPNVLYISIHRYEQGRFYPGTVYGCAENCGEGAGLGRSVNIPWPCSGMGDGDYVFAFQRVVMPIAYEFNPDLVIISSGFDAAAGDHIGQCLVTPPAYAHMTQMLMGLADGKVFASLEGGYSLDAISVSALAVAQSLIGIPPSRLHTVYASQHAVQTVDKVTEIQSQFWRCMRPKYIPANPDNAHVSRLHDIIRSYQAKKLFEDWKITNLPILRDSLSETFANQALCSNDFFQKDVLVILIHEAPLVLGDGRKDSNALKPSDSYLVDPASLYIEWAMQQNFGLIDVNIPEVVTGENKPYDMLEETKKLCTYIWDNYIELASAKNIFFIASGKAAEGVMNLIASRNVTKTVRCIVNFFGSEPLTGLKTASEDDLPSWYFRHSLIFVHSSDECWKKPKKNKRRYGRLIQSEHHSGTSMLEHHYRAVTQYFSHLLKKNGAS
ncbi:histone deacetylase (class II) Clr3 [Schizosaccharomyces osmophilus]|uniref:Histone deacetylase n=1 Tax=Schizosaccharomyces osmophilus TaxID=2545709 RepID=A0AAE9WAQ9_9SCHI|nr:histone deacetylase (class II) Clr3 [Schizosaccharomyces osmophilus]WBW72877.1 histone deacetylase (class II) Clr3 [Schizosaccharomyces osmophilus]